jgi:hypothetical protein
MGKFAPDKTQPRGPGEVFFVRADPLAQLQQVAAIVKRGLDTTHAIHGTDYEIWQRADRIIRLCAERSAPRPKEPRLRRLGCWVPAEAAGLFNQLVNDGVSLQLPHLNVPVLISGPLSPTINRFVSLKPPRLNLPVLVSGPLISASRDHEVRELSGSVGLMIYSYVFLNAEAQRLKVCQHQACTKLFVDRSRGNRALRCSAACTWKAWNRAARRAAGHGRSAKRGKQHGSS